jgi:hypothetical protein
MKGSIKMAARMGQCVRVGGARILAVGGSALWWKGRGKGLGLRSIVSGIY